MELSLIENPYTVHAFVVSAYTTVTLHFWLSSYIKMKSAWKLSVYRLKVGILSGYHQSSLSNLGLLTLIFLQLVNLPLADPGLLSISMGIW